MSPWPGKVLGRRQHVRGVDAVDDSANRGRDGSRARAVAPPPHDRRWSAADIGDRAEVEVEAQRLDRRGHLGRSRLADRHRIAWHRADGEADLAAFLVGRGDETMAVRRANFRDQRFHRGGGGCVVVEVHDQQAAELALLPIGEHRVGEAASEADHDHRADLLIERQAARSQLVGGRWRGHRRWRWRCGACRRRRRGCARDRRGAAARNQECGEQREHESLGHEASLVHVDKNAAFDEKATNACGRTWRG